MFNKKVLLGLFSGFIAASVHAAPAPAAPARSYDDGARSDMKVGVGVQHLAYSTGGGAAINQLHLSVGLNERMYLGLGFGISKNFGSAAIGGDMRFDVIKRGLHAFFLGLNANYIRETEQNGFAAGLLMGFNYAMTENLHASFAYGVQLQFGLNSGDHVATTNAGGSVGNFGLHWYF